MGNCARYCKTTTIVILFVVHIRKIINHLFPLHNILSKNLHVPIYLLLLYIFLPITTYTYLWTRSKHIIQKAKSFLIILNGNVPRWCYIIFVSVLFLLLFLFLFFNPKRGRCFWTKIWLVCMVLPLPTNVANLLISEHS